MIFENKQSRQRIKRIITSTQAETKCSPLSNNPSSIIQLDLYLSNSLQIQAVAIQCPKLKSLILDLKQNYIFQNEHEKIIDTIVGMNCLEELILSQIKRFDCMKISLLPGLKHLYIQCFTQDNLCQIIPKLKLLEKLKVKKIKTNGSKLFFCINQLPNFKSLEIQEIAKSSCQEFILCLCQNMSHLKQLEIMNNNISQSQIMRVIYSLRSLQKLIINPSRINNTTLLNIIQCLPNIKHFSFRNVNLSGIQIQLLSRLLKNIQIIDLAWSQVDNRVLSQLSTKCQQLIDVNLRNNLSFEQKIFLQFVNDQRKLKRLILNNCIQIDNLCILTISKCLLDLEELGLQKNHQITNRGIINLSRLKKLKSLNIISVAITMETITKLMKNIIGLEKIWMSQIYEYNYQSELVIILPGEIKYSSISFAQLIYL